MDCNEFSPLSVSRFFFVNPSLSPRNAADQDLENLLQGVRTWENFKILRRAILMAFEAGGVSKKLKGTHAGSNFNICSSKPTVALSNFLPGAVLFFADPITRISALWNPGQIFENSNERAPRKGRTLFISYTRSDYLIIEWCKVMQMLVFRAAAWGAADLVFSWTHFNRNKIYRRTIFPFGKGVFPAPQKKKKANPGGSEI